MKTFNDSGLRSGQSNANLAQIDSLRKKCSFLETSLKEQIEKREEAETKLQQYRERSLRTEKQFQRVLEKYDGNIAVLNGKESYGQEIWNKLTDQIEKFNENSEKVLEKRCSEILSIMQRKINTMIDKTDQQMKKNKKLSLEEYKSIKEQIKEAFNLAREIEEESEKTKNANKDLEFKVKILREEKNLLVQELNQKKLLLQKIKKQYIDPFERSKVTPRHRSIRNVSAQYSKTPKYVGQPSLKMSSISIDNPEARRGSVSSSRGKDRSQIIMKTDYHYKLCLEREKRKGSELKSIVAKFQTKNKDICVLIDRVLKDTMKEKLTTEKERKLRAIIEDIRMSVVLISTPQKQIGLSQLQLSQILNS